MRQLVVSAALVLALAACNKDKSTTITTADGKQVKITATDASDNGGTITMQDGNGGGGTFAYGENAAKQELPLGLPIYPGAQVSTAVTGSQDGKSGGMFTIESKTGTAQEIADYYRAEVEKRGFKAEVSGLTGANIAGFRAKGADGKNVVLSARPGGPNGETHAIIIIGND